MQLFLFLFVFESLFCEISLLSLRGFAVVGLILPSDREAACIYDRGNKLTYKGNFYVGKNSWVGVYLT